jgi:hypothetical protein
MLLSFSLFRSCAVDARIRKAKLAYQELRAITEADKQLSDNRIGQLTKSIVDKDRQILNIEKEITQKDEQLTVVNQRLRDLQAAEPPTTPEIEALPIVVNLRGQVAKLTGMFNLSQNVVVAQSQEIVELKGKVGLLELVAAEWKGAYNREYALRLSSEKLLTIAENRGIVFKLFGIKINLVKDVVVPGLTFGLGYLCGK